MEYHRITLTKLRVEGQIYAVIAASVNFVSTGYHFGWLSPSLAQLQAEDSDFPVTSSQISWIASFHLIGSIFGSIGALFLIEKFGRRTILLWTSVPHILSCLIIASANNYWSLYIARFIAGVAIGVVFSAAPMYIGEVTEDRLRGGLSSLMSVMMSFGFLIPYSIGPWASRPILAGVGAVIPVLFVLIFFWVPESPYYHAMKNREYMIKKSLMWLRGTYDVDDEVRTICNSVAEASGRTGTTKDLFTKEGNRKAFIIMNGLLSCQQFSGITAFLAYSTIIFNEAGTKINSSFAVLITGIILFVTAVLVTFLVDKAGRRPLLLGSTSLCAVFLLGVGAYFHLQENGNDVSRISWIAVASTVGYLICFSSGIGTLPLGMSAEMFACEIKSIAFTFSTIYLSLIGVLVTKLYQMVTDTYGIHVAFYIFAGCSVLSTAFVYFVVPETRRRSLKDIQTELQGKIAEDVTETMMPLSETATI